MSKTTYAVIGTGAIGGFYGACLQKAGYQVHFLLHNDYHYIKKYGLTIESPQGDFYMPQVKAYQEAKEMPQVDVVIIALKTTTNNILPYVLPWVLKEQGVVLLLQNGMGIEPEIAKIVGKAHLIAGLCFICVNKIGSGHIRHLDYGAIALGEYKNNYQAVGITPRMEQIAEDFRESGIEVNLRENLLLSRWHKLVWNIPYNGLSVILQATTEQIMIDSHSRLLAREIMEEVLLAAKSNNCVIHDSYIETMLSVTEKMKPYKTSMKIDYDLGCPLEIEAIVGNPLRIANKTGVELPRIEMLYQQLKFLEAHNNKNGTN